MSLREMGQNAMLDVINNKRDIAKYINSIAKEPQLFAGAVMALVGVYEAVRARGVVPSHPDEEMDAFLHSGKAAMSAAFYLRLQRYNASRDWLDTHLDMLIHIINQTRASGHIYRFAAVDTPPAPPPLAMAIVSMPDRAATTTVTRNKNDEIVKTEFVEKDA